MTSLPDLSSHYEVSPAAAEQFRRAGHIRLEAVATPDEIGAYRPEILRARELYGQEAVPLEQRDTYGRAFLKGMNLWPKDDAVRRFVLSRRFAEVAANLMGVAGVRIYHDQALLKEPGGGPTPWHQDQHYWPLDTDNTVTMWMPLVDLSPEMGVMRFASGSHRGGYLGDMPISDESEAHFDAYVASRGFEVVQGAAMGAGDATFHYGWTLHAAPGNSTDRSREVMTIIWFADGARVTEPDNRSRARDLERWLPGLRSGELAASELNPLVYSR